MDRVTVGCTPSRACIFDITDFDELILRYVSTSSPCCCAAAEVNSNLS